MNSVNMREIHFTLGVLGGFAVVGKRHEFFAETKGERILFLTTDVVAKLLGDIPSISKMLSDSSTFNT
jgi:hypothetical protein